MKWIRRVAMKGVSFASGALLRSLIFAVLPYFAVPVLSTVFSWRVTTAVAFMSLAKGPLPQCVPPLLGIQCRHKKLLHFLRQNRRGLHVMRLLRTIREQNQNAHLSVTGFCNSSDECEETGHAVSTNEDKQCVTFMNQVPIETFKNKIVLAGIQVGIMIYSEL